MYEYIAAATATKIRGNTLSTNMIISLKNEKKN